MQKTDWKMAKTLTSNWKTKFQLTVSTDLVNNLKRRGVVLNFNDLNFQGYHRQFPL